MPEYIERDALLNALYDADAITIRGVSIINRFPAADVVSRAAYDQTDWERCVALTQLKEIGKGLGERMDDVRPVVLCRDCKYAERTGMADGCVWCNENLLGRLDDDFCSRGADMREES